jgi:hypothetical protein
MKTLSCIVGTLAAIFVTEASAQVVDLTGRYRCIQVCSAGSIGKSGYVTRGEWGLNVRSETGASSRSWIQWFSPHRMWLEDWNEGAVFSADGMIIRFDRGTIWQHDSGKRVALRSR